MAVGRSYVASEQNRAQLVASLRSQEAIRSERVAQAFLAIPREAFVPFFYEQEGFQWVKRTADLSEPEAWLAAIYRDWPLVTLIDQRNRSISSSSMPTVMAMMLEALAVQPGMRVLEIGAGSGYNAALLTHLAGDAALVTSIELEESLARAAVRALSEVIGPVSVHVGDGRSGALEHAPYDRIIATASAPGIPCAWYEQLAPGGRLVMDLQGSLHQSSFLVLDKARDGSAQGQLDPRSLFFMPLRSSGEVVSSPTSRLLLEPVSSEITLSAKRVALLEQRAFLWFLQWYAPGITLSRAMVLQGKRAGQAFLTLIDGKQELLLQLYQEDGQWSGRQHGGTGIWELIERAFQVWVDLDRPVPEAFEVVWQHSQGRFGLELSPGKLIFPL